MIDLWMVPIALAALLSMLAALLSMLGWIGAFRRSRKHTGRIKRAWDVPGEPERLP